MTDPSITDLVGALRMKLETMRRDIDTLRATGKFKLSFLASAEYAAVDWFVILTRAVTGVAPAEPVPRIALPFDPTPEPKKDTI